MPARRPTWSCIATHPPTHPPSHRPCAKSRSGSPGCRRGSSMVPSVRIMLSGFLACSTADVQHVSKSRVGSAGAGTAGAGAPPASGLGPQPSSLPLMQAPALLAHPPHPTCAHATTPTHLLHKCRRLPLPHSRPHSLECRPHVHGAGKRQHSRRLLQQLHLGRAEQQAGWRLRHGCRPAIARCAAAAGCCGRGSRGACCPITATAAAGGTGCCRCFYS